MRTIYLAIADFNIEINFSKTEWILLKNKLLKEVLYYCKKFLNKTKPNKIDFSITITQRKNTEIIVIRNMHKNYINLYETEKEKHYITFYQISTPQFLLILRSALVKLLSSDSGFLLHASASYVNNKATIFLGKEGSGKSTMIDFLKNRYVPLVDDIAVIRKKNAAFYFYQTPFLEKLWIEKKSSNYQIGKAFFLKKADFISIEQIVDKEYILRKLIPLTSLDNKYIKSQFACLLEFVKRQDFYFLNFPNDRGRVREIFKKI